MAYGYGFGRKYWDKLNETERILLVSFVISVFLSATMFLGVLFFYCVYKAFAHIDAIQYRRYDVFASGRPLKKENRNNKAESPIEIIVTIMVFLILMTGVVFAEGVFIDGFLFQISKLPITLSPRFQEMMMNSPIMLASIFFSIPVFFGAVLIVWGVKSIIRKHGYTRSGEEIYYDEGF